MTQPSVCRDVHYIARGSADGVYPAVCRAAKVTEVSSDGTNVNLVVFNPEGIHFPHNVPQGAPLGQDGADGGTWHWPERV